MYILRYPCFLQAGFACAPSPLRETARLRVSSALLPLHPNKTNARARAVSAKPFCRRHPLLAHHSISLRGNRNRSKGGHAWPWVGLSRASYHFHACMRVTHKVPALAIPLFLSFSYTRFHLRETVPYMPQERSSPCVQSLHK